MKRNELLKYLVKKICKDLGISVLICTDGRCFHMGGQLYKGSYMETI